MYENLLDIKQVAEYLQMNKMTVYKLAREGKIPAFKVASEWRFRKDLLDKWMWVQMKGKRDMTGCDPDPKPKNAKSVLIVDDDDVIRDFFTRALTGYRVLAAANGEEAVNVVKKDRPSLVLLDINMPGIDGIETLRRIKAFDNSIPVIMLSAYATLETNLQAARLGAYNSISKPFDLKDMEAVIKNAISSTRPPSE